MINDCDLDILEHEFVEISLLSFADAVHSHDLRDQPNHHFFDQFTVVDLLKDSEAVLLQLGIIGVGSLPAVDRGPKVLRLGIVRISIDGSDIADDDGANQFVVGVAATGNLTHEHIQQ